MDLIKLQSNISKLDVIDLFSKILEENDEFIADLNRSQLADKGVREDGTKITPEYADLTEWFKRQKSGTAGIISHVTLYDTGTLHKSITASVIRDSLILDSKDSKVDELTEKYGEFLGLTDESIEKLRAKVLPIFEQRFYAAILQ